MSNPLIEVISRVVGTIGGLLIVLGCWHLAGWIERKYWK